MSRRDPEVVALRKEAEAFAKKRRERVTTTHLLAVVVLRGGPAADLLQERGLNGERLLKAARSSTDARERPLDHALQGAREIAGRMVAQGQPAALHLLLALLTDRTCAAYRCLEQCGVDVGRLRLQALNHSLGLVSPRRQPVARGTTTGSRRQQPTRDGVAIPIVPQAPREEEPKKPTATPTTSAAAEPPAGSVLPVAPPNRPSPKKAKKKATPKARSTTAPKTPLHRFELEPKRYPTLVELGKNLTLAAARGELDPVVGREPEIEQALDILAKRHGNNPCLVGVAGVGKTSVVRGIAARIAAQRDVISLDDRIIVEISASELIAGTGVRGALAQRVTALRDEVQSAEGRIVVFFDEIHQLFIGDAAEELTGELKLALARGVLPCIGATTCDEYRRSIDADPALARRFTAVEVDEPSRADAYLVLAAVAKGLEEHHGVSYSEDALALSIAWSVRYLPSRALPDKAVAIVDLAGARCRRRGETEVTPRQVAEVVSEMADVPLERLLETDRERMLKLEELLAQRVVGHEERLRRIARILRRNGAGLNRGRPIGTFLLLGPTGVGKTETAKAIAQTLFYSEQAMTRIDMSELSEPHTVARLIGSPPGYVGHEAGGQLTEAVRKRPYQVVLLDEIEKAHPEVLMSFLQVFDEGRLTDGRGRTVDFTNTVIVVTSNLGATAHLSAPRKVGFGASRDSGAGRKNAETAIAEAARASLAPELYNRIDEVLVFLPLERSAVAEITRRMLDGLATRLAAEQNLTLEVDDDVIELLLDSGGFEPSLGARPMKRTIARMLEAPLAEKLLAGDVVAGDAVLVGATEDELSFDVVEGKPDSGVRGDPRGPSIRALP